MEATMSTQQLQRENRRFEGTGGVIDRMTATEQLLYEVTDPSAYLTPDITADFTAVTIAETAPDTIAVSGARGKTRPATLKVSVGYHAGYIGEGEISYAGENCVARARLGGEIVAERLRGQFQELRVDILGLSALHTRPMSGGDYRPYEVRLRVAAADARFGIPAARLGIVYSQLECQSLIAAVGVTAAKRILFGAAQIDAAEALRIGLIDELAAGDQHVVGGMEADEGGHRGSLFWWRGAG